ncbi:MAG: rhodanese-like domain-containing protein [Planctomycetota bacterium]|nr:rhodanese-like domain-containing protein [Planctomycetota bacterium]
MILKQYYLGCLSHASYLIADEESGEAAIVDPQRDVDGYLTDAEKQGLRIRHVILTHFHADFVSGHLELLERTGATIHIGARGRADYAFHPVADGDLIEVGSVRLVVLETPGHTPEGISILVFDPEEPDRPHAVLTGDTLFIGDVGRPDLMASVGFSAEELAGMLYDSLRGKILPLPDETLVYPAHGAGSACGQNLSNETFATLGQQRACNWALQPLERDEFVRTLTATQSTAPAYFAYDADLNKRERPTLEDSLARGMKALSPSAALEAVASGAQLLDVRPPEEFAAGHVAGSVNVGLEGRYASWVGTVLENSSPIVLIAPAGREREAALRLGRIGFVRIAGYVEGGFAALSNDPAAASRIVRIRRLSPDELERELAGAEPPLVIDVRGPGEHEDTAIEGSVLFPLTSLCEQMNEVPRDRPLVLHCATGYRSMIAASILAAAGVEVADLEGGIVAWATRRKPTVSAAG